MDSGNPLPRILLQLDSDPQPSAFDAIVALDSGVDRLLQYHRLEESQVRDLVHGAIFTRGMDQLRGTAIFVGGSDVPAAEKLLRRIVSSFFGPMRVSVMMDPNGANTTAVAAVLTASRELELPKIAALVLAATGPVGQRVTRLLARTGCQVRVGSRDLARAQRVCEEVVSAIGESSEFHPQVRPVLADRPDAIISAATGVQLVISAGAAGARMVGLDRLVGCGSIRLAMDLNAVPPAGIDGIEVSDKRVQRDGIHCYGAVGVGGLKMKVHRAAVQALFATNDRILDAEELFEIGQALPK